MKLWREMVENILFEVLRILEIVMVGVVTDHDVGLPHDIFRNTMPASQVKVRA